MQRHSVTGRSRSRRRALFAPIWVLLLGLAPLSGQAGATQQAAEPEVVAVVDVTAEASCDVVYTRYADETFTKVIEESTPQRCQGGMIRTFGTTRREAQARGYQFAPLTGSRAADRATVGALVAELHAANAARFNREADPFGDPAAATRSFLSPGAFGAAAVLPSAVTCSTGSYPDYRSARMTHTANGGASVRTYVYYKRYSDCVGYTIYTTRSAIWEAGSGRVYWRAISSSDPRKSAYLACIGLTTSYKAHDISPPWYMYSGTLFTTETYPSAACTGWGDSTSGSVYLYGYQDR